MKTKLFAFGIMILTIVMFNGCNKDNLLTKDIDLILNQDFTVNNVNDTIFTGIKLLDASAQSSDIETYKDHIENLSITKITYLLSAFNGPTDQQLLHGQIDLTDTAEANPVNLASMTNVLLSSLLNTETELQYNAAGQTFLIDKLKNSPHALKVSYLGNLNKKPLDFTIRLKIYVKMKVKIV